MRRALDASSSREKRMAKRFGTVGGGGQRGAGAYDNRYGCPR